MSKHVVLGARGGTGSQIVKALLLKSPAVVSHVCAVVRNTSSNAEEWTNNDRVTLVAGDVTDPASLDCMTDADTVYFCCAGKGYDLCQAVDRDGVLNAAQSSLKYNVRRLVLVSSQLVDPTHNSWNFVRGILNTINTGLFHRKGMMDFKFAGENLLRSSGQAYTIVRPGRLGDGSLDLSKAVIGVGQTNRSYLSNSVVTREALAQVCIEAALSKHAKNITFEIGTKPPVTDGNDAGLDMFAGFIQDNDRKNDVETTTCA